MKTQNLIKISLAISIIGIFILLLILEYFPPDLVKLQDLTEDYLETSVRIQGTITQIKETPTVLILKLKDSNKLITVIAFEEAAPLDLKLNSQVEILGKVESYENELEIITDKITLLK